MTGTHRILEAWVAQSDFQSRRCHCSINAIHQSVPMSKDMLVLVDSEIHWKSHKQTLQFMDRKHSQWFNEAFFWQSGTYYLSKFAGLPVCETSHLWPGGPFPSFDLLRVGMISLISIKSNGPRLWKSENSKHIQAHENFLSLIWNLTVSSGCILAGSTYLLEMDKSFGNDKYPRLGR